MKTGNLLPAVFLAVLAVCLPALAVDPIPEVKTLEQLLALKPVHLTNGPDIRLGISGGGRDAGPWKLLYCHVKHPEKIKREQRTSGKRYGEILGPVFFVCEAPQFSLEAQVGILEVGRQSDADEELFCGLVPLAWKGDYLLQIMRPDGGVLQEKKFTVATETACLWRNFVVERPSPEGQLDTRNNVAARDTGMVHPRYDGTKPIFQTRGEMKLIKAAGGKTRRAEHDNFLPGAIPLDDIWVFLRQHKPESRRVGEESFPLKLTLDKTAFVLESPVPMLDEFEDTLLARWWVNGKPIVPGRSNGSPLEGGARNIIFLKTVRVGFDLPKDLGLLKEGDRVKLQVLYNSHGYLPITTHRPEGEVVRMMLLGEDEPAPPLLSNVLEFTITKELLSRVGWKDKVNENEPDGSRCMKTHTPMTLTDRRAGFSPISGTADCTSAGRASSARHNQAPARRICGRRAASKADSNQ